MQWEKSSEVFQRVHSTRVDSGTVFVRIDNSKHPVESDRYCHNAKAGKVNNIVLIFSRLASYMGKETKMAADGKRVN